MNNTRRWVLMFVLTFLTAAIQAMVDGHAVLADILRHGFIGLLPSIAALRMTLEASGVPAVPSVPSGPVPTENSGENNNPAEKQKGASA